MHLGEAWQWQSEDGVEDLRAILVLGVEGQTVVTLGDKG